MLVGCGRRSKGGRHACRGSPSGCKRGRRSDCSTAPASASHRPEPQSRALSLLGKFGIGTCLPYGRPQIHLLVLPTFFPPALSRPPRPILICASPVSFCPLASCLIPSWPFPLVAAILPCGNQHVWSLLSITASPPSSKVVIRLSGIQPCFLAALTILAFRRPMPATTVPP